MNWAAIGWLVLMVVFQIVGKVFFRIWPFKNIRFF